MNVDRRWLGTSVVRVRVLAAGLVLLGAGCAVLGWGSRSRQTAANAAAQSSAIEEPATAGPSCSGDSARAAERNERGSAVSGALAVRRAAADLRTEPGTRNLDPADPRAKFVTRGSGYSLFLGSEGAILSLVSRERSKRSGPKGFGKQEPSVTRVESLQMKLAGANPNASLTGADLLPGKSNYFLGNDPAKWRTRCAAVCAGALRECLSRNQSGLLRKSGTSGI